MLWDLYQDMRQLQKEIDSLFEYRSMLPRLYHITAAQSKYPPINLREDTNNMFLDIRLPGLDIDKIKINIKARTLGISGQKPSPDGIDQKDYHRRERITGNFIRAVDLPMDVDVAKVKADYENGIVTISLPKTESAKPKKIEVKIK